MSGHYRFRRSFGNVNSRFRGATPKHFPLFTGLLDDFGGAAAAYSLRALSANWVAGDVVEVRRSSDSTSQDFTASQITNGELETFCGVGDGFVSIWYDQSGNANNATQGTTTAQPKIVSAGALVVGGLDFDGVDDTLNTSLIPPSTVTMIGVSTWDIEDATQMIVGARDSTSLRNYIAQNSSGKITIAASLSFVGTVDVVASTDYLSFGVINGTDLDMSVNGVNEAGTGTAPVNTTHGYNIGSLNDAGTAGSFMNGRIAEVIVYASDQSANRVAIETNINAAYTIF